ncbi:hypothetical protein FB451DRAFT_1407900 [Mycena latifolia]|nr:hypothetical protein FB451DRAFT_1407900 [Mycena latifolia]
MTPVSLPFPFCCDEQRLQRPRLGHAPPPAPTHHRARRDCRSFTTVDSSTRNADEETDPCEMHPLFSPPTSHEFVYEEVEEEEGQGSSRDEPAAGAGVAPHASKSYALEMHPWCKPSDPVLLALAPPCPGASTTPRARAALLPPPQRPGHACRRALELLLLLCLAAPPLCVLLRALLFPSPSISSASGGTEPLSWFSTTLFALLASLRAASTFHALIHAHSHSAATTAPSAQQAQQAQAEVEPLRARLARLEDALAPLEKGARRGERHFADGGETGKGEGTPGAAEAAGPARGVVYILVFVLVCAPACLPSSAFLSTCVYSRARARGIPSPNSRRAGGLEPILEEREGEPGASASASTSTSAYPSTSTSTSAYPHPYTAATSPPALIYASTPQLLLLLLRWCVALAFWPLRTLLL